MPGRRVSHSESRWVLLPDTVIRCNGTLQSGKRCRREAIEGSVVCEILADWRLRCVTAQRNE